MAIWTSRYSNKELQNGNYYCVGISLGTPKFPLGFQIREQCYSLAPKGYMLKMEYEPYKEAYIKKLEADLERVRAELVEYKRMYVNEVEKRLSFAVLLKEE